MYNNPKHRSLLHWVFLFALCIFAFQKCAKAQGTPPQKISSNYEFKAVRSDSGSLGMPIYTTLPASPPSNYVSNGGIAFQLSDSSHYKWSTLTNTWTKLSSSTFSLFAKKPNSILGTDTVKMDTMVYRKIYNVVQFGADSTFSTDATPGIIAAINAAAANGGGRVYVPRGRYKIAGALNVSCNCQIPIPVVAISSPYRSKIEIFGEESTAIPSGYLSPINLRIPTGGSNLISTISGSGSNPSVIAMIPSSGPFGNFSYQDVEFRNIGVQLFTNSGASAVSMTGFYMYNAATVSFYNSYVSADVENQLTQNPTANEVAGIVLGNKGNDGPNVLERVTTSATKYGIVGVEHTIYNNVYAIGCNYGFVFPKMDFINRGSVLVHACNHAVLIPNTTIMGVLSGNTYINMDMELEQDSGAITPYWYATVDDIQDPGNFGHGFIRINNINGGSSINNNFRITCNGCNNLNVMNYENFTPGNLSTRSFDSTLSEIGKNIHFIPSSVQWQYQNTGPAGTIQLLNNTVIFRSWPSQPAGTAVGVGTATNQLYLGATNNGMGTVSPISSALLDLSSTTKGLAPPRMTTVQKNAIATPGEGLLVYDLTLHQMSYFNGTTWINF